MRRELVRLEDIADVRTLSWAFWRAARGKVGRRDVADFARQLDEELSRLGHEILSGTVPVGDSRRFLIRDPKLRTIHAPVFRERVLHHALMRFVQPPLERSLVADTYACRVGKGSLAAVRRAASHMDRFPWFVKCDIRTFFNTVVHDILLSQLANRVKGRGVLDLCARIVRAYESEPGKGLPIGALTSQHFANAYLAPLDRFLLESLQVRGMIRYMDDVVWWTRNREESLKTLSAVRRFVRETLGLQVKSSVQVRPSSLGVTVCGFRILHGTLRLGKRRRQRYVRMRAAAEAAYRDGLIDALTLQRLGSVALAITAHASARAWRRVQLERVPPPDA